MKMIKLSNKHDVGAKTHSLYLNPKHISAIREVDVETGFADTKKIVTETHVIMSNSIVYTVQESAD